MFNITGYTISQALHESPNSLIYRGVRAENNQSIILKILRADYPAPQQTSQFNREYEFTKDLNIPGIRLGNPDQIEGSLPYISPEQSGRMNRSVDFRYQSALGVRCDLEQIAAMLEDPQRREGDTVELSSPHDLSCGDGGRIGACVI